MTDITSPPVISFVERMQAAHYREEAARFRSLAELVPLHKGFDELIVAGAQGRQRFGIDQ